MSHDYKPLANDVYVAAVSEPRSFLPGTLVLWLLRAAVTTGLIVLVAIFVDIGAALRAIGDADPYLFVAALAVAIAAWLVNSLKWWLLLEPVLPGISIARLCGWNFRAIFYGQVLPGMLAGDAVKGYRLYRETGSAARIIMSIGVDRLTGLVALGMLGSLALARSADVRSDESYIIVVGALALVVPLLLLVLLCVPSVLVSLSRLERYRLLARAARYGVEIIEPYHSRYLLLAVALLLAIAFQLLGGVLVYLLARGIDMPVAFVDLLWVYAAVSLVSLLPISLGGLGAREGALILFLRPLGVESEAALTLGFLVFGIQLALALIGAGLEVKEAIRPGGKPASSPVPLMAGPEGFSRGPGDA